MVDSLAHNTHYAAAVCWREFSVGNFIEREKIDKECGVKSYTKDFPFHFLVDVYRKMCKP